MRGQESERIRTLSTIEAQRDVAPPPDWQPKSAFWKSIMEQARDARVKRRIALACPDCGASVVMKLEIELPITS